MAATGSDSH